MLDKQKSFIVSRRFAIYICIYARCAAPGSLEIVHKQIIAKLKCEIALRRADMKIVGQEPQDVMPIGERFACLFH